MGSAADMLAVVFDSPGSADQLRLERLPLPVCAEGEVLVRVAAAGVNRPDVLQRQGLYPPPPNANPRLGLEISGEVVALGEGVSANLLGRSVMALVNGGGYAEYVAVPAAQTMRVPSGVSLIHAAGLPEVYLTVWQNLVKKGALAAGQRVLVHGGSSGIGSAAIQLVKALGAQVYVTVGDASKANYCRKLGADEVFLYREESFSERVMEVSQGQGVDLVLDMVAGAYLNQDLACLAVGGKVLVIALLGGRKAEIDAAQLLFKQATLCGTTLRPQSAQFKADLCQEVEAFLEASFAQGKLKTTVDSVFELADVVKAHRHMESGQHFGKIILKISDQE